MKKVLFFAAIALIFAACNSTAKFKPMIEELSSKWESTTGMVGEFANAVTTEQSNWTGALSTLNVAPEAMAKWDAATKGKFAEMKSAVDGSTSGLGGISTELGAFMGEWKTKTAEVNKLTDGLKAGKLEGNVQETITSLTSSLSDATTKLDGWKTKFNEVKSMAATAQKNMTDFIAANVKAAPTTAPAKK